MTQLVQQERPDPALSSGAPQRPASSHRVTITALILLTLVMAGGFSVARRFSERKALAKETEKLAIPAVAVIRPSAEPAQDELTLPAQLQAYVESSIYARTNGYLLHWYKDIGSHVKKGELLADIDTPEVDQELMQAKAARQQIVAQMDLAKISAERWSNLRKTDSVSQQEADQQTSAYTQAQANLAAADANVRRLEQMESFKHIYAPFAGVITRRNVDIGALISAGSSTQTKELFDLAQVDPLRVFVSMPQATAVSIRPGVPAYIELNEYPGQKFSGKVARTADAIDPATRTMLTEVDIPNHEGKLLPGAYAQVHFAVPVHTTRLSVPVNSLLFRPEGPRVAVVGPDQKVHLAAIVIGRDFGNKVEIVTGLSATDQIVVNPADSLEEGQQVIVRKPEGGA
jgi:RND family efflux transporter MFP subunit